MPPDPVATAYPVESVDRALRLLLLMRERGAVSVGEAARALDVAPSTAHRLLNALLRRGFAEQDPTSRAYGPGPVLLELGLRAARGLDIRALARPAMEALVRAVGETAHLAVLRGTDALFLESVESDAALRVTNRAGTTLPAHATACGKALLAGLSAAELRARYPAEALPLPQPRPRALARRADLEAELARVRERGYATNFDESEPGVSGVAAAIVDAAGRVRAAVTVSAPISRLDEAQVARIADAVRRAAAEIGAGLR